MIIRILEHARERGEEIEIEDGFDMYRQLVATRRLYMENLPGYTTLLSSSLHVVCANIILH